MENKEGESGTRDPFPAEAYVDQNDRATAPKEVDEFWVTMLSSGPQLIDTGAFPDILEQTDWFASDLQEPLKRLIKASKIQNLSAKTVRANRKLTH